MKTSELHYGFIADLHLGDPRHASRLKRSMIEHAELIIDGMNAQLSGYETLILVGDIICDPDYIEYLTKLNCRRIIYILGNRESRDTKIVRKLFESDITPISSMRLPGGILITHIPPHSHEAARYNTVIHGHLHNDIIYSDKYVNVSEPMTKGKIIWLNDIVKTE